MDHSYTGIWNLQSADIVLQAFLNDVNGPNCVEGRAGADKG